MPYKDKVKRYQAVRRSIAQKPDYYREQNTVRQRKPQRVNYMLLRRYGITLETYNKTLETQGGGCAICGGVHKQNRLHVDHNHKTKKVRGILCASCNRSIAALDNVEWLRKAKEYLANNS